MMGPDKAGRPWEDYEMLVVNDLRELKGRMTNVEERVSELGSTVKTWVGVGGVLITAATILVPLLFKR